MSSISDIVARPAIPIELIIALGAVAAALILFSLSRGLAGAWLRLGVVLALMLALLNPAAVNETRDGLTDVGVIVVDESPSQTLEDRMATATQTAAALETAARQLDAETPGRAPLDLRVVRVAGDGAEGTRLLTALGEALADVAPERVAGAVMITDGAIADADRLPTIFSGRDATGNAAYAPPLHVLLTGREDEFDRRLVLETAPGFGLVGEKVALRFRVEENGEAPAGLAAPAVRVLIDGQPAAAALARIGRSIELEIDVAHPGVNVVELRLDVVEGELTDRNNSAAFTLNGVRDRLRVLLVSGEPHAGERTWRNLLKSDPSVDLVHFTILRPPRKRSFATVNELALIPFPTRELFEVKLDEFDLIVFDRYRRWGILETRYIENIANYVKEGGAVLIASGPAFAGLQSMYRTPLAEVLPAAPTSIVVQEPFLPEVTDLGGRHPVTRELPGRQANAGARPSWGRWFRQIDVELLGGDVIMSGAAEKPLLILDRVDEGRVAMLASDHAWLWARGYDGGGPQAELLRRLAHWLMKEPELEEEALTAAPAAGGFTIERRSLTLGDKSVVTVSPGGEETSVALTPVRDGLWRAVVATEELGLHSIRDAESSEIGEDGPLQAIAVVGPASPREFANPISTADILGPMADATGGAVWRLGEKGVPDLRRTREGRAAEGSRWIGLARRDAYTVTGVELSPLAPPWLMFGLAGLFAIAAWRVEGR
ncbi:MAG: hypothetical protein AAF811_10480 [Pseudomonadota bacterium]